MKQLLTIALIVTTVANLQASSILVDNFSTDQFVQAGPVGVNPLIASGGVATGANSIGSARTVSVTRTSGNSIEFVNIAGGIAEISTGAGDTATTLFTWDGDTSSALNATGLGGIDLTGGGSNILVYMALRSDLANAPVTLTVYTDGSNASSTTIMTPGGGFATAFTAHHILFSAFTTTLGSGANFANVGAITLSVDGSAAPGLDTQIDLVEASAVPEPSTMALIGAGLVAAALKGRKRK